jgi:hypothetical protein
MFAGLLRFALLGWLLRARGLSVLLLLFASLRAVLVASWLVASWLLRVRCFASWLGLVLASCLAWLLRFVLTTSA